jgi:hypothetical protein
VSRKRDAGTLTTRMQARWCPNCFYKLDATTSMYGEHAPKPGDFTVCAQCASVLRFKEGMDVVLSSLLEIPVHSRMGFAKVVQLIKANPMPPPRDKFNPFVKH